MSDCGLAGQSGVGAPLPNPTGQSPRAAAPARDARAEASRKNGARSRGPKTARGQGALGAHALKHGMRAHKHVVLPQEDAAAFAALEGALLAELAPKGALQTVLARRIVVAAWRLARADRLGTDVGLATPASPAPKEQDGQPVGSVFLGLAMTDRNEAKEVRRSRSRTAVRGDQRARQLRRHLLGCA